jgi:glycosyltransferase involved in cell wall biosynthesis
MKTYDAMAMAKPIVASIVSDLPVTLDGCARLVPPRSVGALTASIRDLLEHPAEARAMGERARARCLEKYSMAHVADILADVVLRAREAHAKQQP